jgi:hypothetical protein
MVKPFFRTPLSKDNQVVTFLKPLHWKIPPKPAVRVLIQKEPPHWILHFPIQPLSSSFGERSAPMARSIATACDKGPKDGRVAATF